MITRRQVIPVAGAMAFRLVAILWMVSCTRVCSEDFSDAASGISFRLPTGWKLHQGDETDSHGRDAIYENSDATIIAWYSSQKLTLDARNFGPSGVASHQTIHGLDALLSIIRYDEGGHEGHVLEHTLIGAPLHYGSVIFEILTFGPDENESLILTNALVHSLRTTTAIPVK